MSFFRTLALLLIALAGFSTGAVLGHGAKSASRSDMPRPCLADFAAIFLCWSGVIVSLISGFEPWRTAAVWTLVGLVIAFALHRLQKQPLDDARRRAAQKAEKSKSAQRLASTPGNGWEGWKTIAQAIGGFQNRVLLNGLYYLALAPFGILVGWLGDPLKLKPSPQESFWGPKETSSESLDESRRQS